MLNRSTEPPIFESETYEKRHMLIDVATGALRPVMTEPPRTTSAKTNWEGILLEEHYGREIDTKDTILPHHVVVLQMSEAAPMEIQLDKQANQTIHKMTGLVDFIPARTLLKAKSKNCGDYLAVTLDPNFLFFAVHEMVNADQIEFLPRLQKEDALLRELVLSLKLEIQQGNPGGRIYGESMGAMIALHLARHYSIHKPREISNPIGLSPSKLRRVLDFIEAHLSEAISLKSLAKLVELSTFHFSRQFKKSTSMAPHKFIIRRRIQKSKDLLTSSDISISQAAIATGFCDQSHFATHFKRQCGMTPKKFRIQAAAKKLFS